MAVIGCAALVVGCGTNTGPESGPADSLAALPRTLSALERSGIASSNRFALSLLRQTTASSARNVLLSPLSVWTALGMTMNGATGQTETEMRSTLGWGTQLRAEVNAGYRDLNALLPTLDPAVTMKIANGIWTRVGITPDTAFASDMRVYFGADMRTATTPQAMFDAVNAWGNQQTNGMVPRVLTQPPPDELLMLLANAVHFSGTWRALFRTEDTRPAPFRLENGTTATVPLMSRSGGFRALQASTYVAMELPYGNSAYAMLLLVPTSESVNTLVARLDSAFFATTVAGLTSVSDQSMVFLPRFTISGSLELSRTLATMGMPRAFTDAAEFPRFFGSGAKLGFVQHGVSLEVNERGTRAAAVTVVGVVPTSLPPTFRADRPFVFFIRERFAGTILFAGVIRNPLE